jgi:polar amino acid transport system substrate-binding protein
MLSQFPSRTRTQGAPFGAIIDIPIIGEDHRKMSLARWPMDGVPAGPIIFSYSRGMPMRPLHRPTPRMMPRPIVFGAIAILCSLALHQPAAAQSAAQPTTIVLSRLTSVPDQFVGGEILKAVYARLHITVEFVDVEAQRALALSSAGDVDGEIQRVGNLSEKYPTLIKLSPPINYIEPAVFTTGLTFDVNGWDSIKSHTIGIVRGVGSSEAGTRGMADVQKATSLEDLVRMLDRGRFDLLVTDLFSGRIEVKKQHLDARIRPLLPPLERIYVYHYLNERHRDLVPKVEAVLRDMNASGELARLRAKLVEQVLAKSGQPSG